MCNNALQRSIVSLGTKACTPLGIPVDRPRGASGLGRRKLVELVELQVPVWGAGRGCPEAPPQRAERASQSWFVRLRQGRGVTDHVPEGPSGRQHPSEGCTSSGARGSVPNVHSMEQCSHIQMLGLTLAYLLEQFGAKVLGISHQKLSLNL